MWIGNQKKTRSDAFFDVLSGGVDAVRFWIWECVSFIHRMDIIFVEFLSPPVSPSFLGRTMLKRLLCQCFLYLLSFHFGIRFTLFCPKMKAKRVGMKIPQILYPFYDQYKHIPISKIARHRVSRTRHQKMHLSSVLLISNSYSVSSQIESEVFFSPQSGL